MKTPQFIRSGTHLPVKNLRQTLDYYRDVLGFYDEWVWEDKDGGIRRDELRLLFVENPEHVAAINNKINRLNLVWFVDNIEEIYKEFKNRPVEMVSDLKNYPYQLKEFAFIDINGYYIRIAEGTA